MLNLIARQAPFLSGPARTEAQIKQGAAAGGFADYHATLYVVLAFQLVYVVRHARKLYPLLLRNRILIACLLLPLVSVLWSGNIGNSIRLSIEADACLLFAACLYVVFPSRRLQQFIIFIGVCAALLSAFAAIALPRYGIFVEYAGGAWQGICDHKNIFGVSMAYLLTPVFFIPSPQRRWRLAYAIFLLFLIAMSQSRGAWIETVALLGMIGIMFLLRRLPPAESWLLLIVTGVLGVFILAGVIASFDTIAPLLGKDASMSGRIEIYRQCWLAVQRAPVLGYGYGGFWGIAPEAVDLGISIRWPVIGYAENGFLEVALQLGFVGVAVVVVLLGRAICQGVRLITCRSSSWEISAWYLSILFLALLTNIDAGWLLTPGTLDWVMIVIACLGLNDEMRKYRATSHQSNRPFPQTYLTHDAHSRRV
jgi:O-antigen ligase